MISNRKFENAARSRRVFAFWLALALHLAVAAMLFFNAELGHLLPDFIQGMIADSPAPEPQAVP